MKLALRVSASLLALSACDTPGGRGGATTAPTSTPDAQGSDAATADVAGQDPAVAAVCARWNADRAERDEGAWTGSIATCDPGDVAEPSRTNTLAQVNLYRWLAGLPPVEADAGKNAAAQACALVMHANDAIEHVVPSGWRCREPSGVQAAGLSNLATVPGVAAVDLYMTDEGVDNLGHRRWILSNSLGPIGMGSTSRYSCLHVIYGDGDAGQRWTAWPPPGVVPYGALEMGSGWSRLSTDAAGWSVQSDDVDLRGAEVTVTRDGESLPLDVWTLDSGYGSTFGVGFRPDGWATEPGATYRVRLVLAREELEYDVHVAACD
ncbi:MAG: CAP domain-containing protein [Deltaproteobacteria bacterium]|nr:CAP domain-containing protein [Deltaproteobacteria bacterium]